MNILRAVNREIGVIKSDLKDHFSLYRKWYFLLIIVAIVAIIVGLIVGFSTKDIVITKIPERLFVRFVTGDIGIGSLVLARIATSVVLLILIWLLCARPYLGLISVGIVVYRGFMLGLSSAMLISLFSVAGVLNILLVVVPCYLVMLAVLIAFCVLCLSYSFTSRIYGGCVCSGEFFCSQKKVLIVLGIMILIAVALELILLPLASSTLIVPKS